MIGRSVQRFGDKIMRHFKKLARDRRQNRFPLLLIARGTTPDAAIDASAAGPYGPPPLRRSAR
jgi:hypothetical protein